LDKRKEEPESPVPLGNAVFILLEVTLQQAFQTAAAELL